MTVDSKRWQLVVGCLGAEEPAFSQGALFDFRMRLLGTGMDQRLLERTVDLARRHLDTWTAEAEAAQDRGTAWRAYRAGGVAELTGMVRDLEDGPHPAHR